MVRNVKATVSCKSKLLPFINYTQAAISAAIHYFKSHLVFLPRLAVKSVFLKIVFFYNWPSDIFVTRKPQLLIEMIIVLQNMVKLC